MQETVLLSDDQRARLLDVEVERYLVYGFRVESRTATSAQLLRPRTFSFLWATLWFLVFGVGLVFYLIYYAAKRDTLVHLSIDEQGNLHRSSSAKLGSLPPLHAAPEGEVNERGRRACGRCGHQNSPSRLTCKQCRAPLA